MGNGCGSQDDGGSGQGRDRFEPVIAAIADSVFELLRARGASGKTLGLLYRHFVGQLVPVDESGLACGPGCGSCCHLRVGCSPAEILVILNYLADHGLVAQFRGLAGERLDEFSASRGQDAAWWAGKRLPCLFLDQPAGICTIYPVRPFSCRAYHSLDLSACLQGFQSRSIVAIPCIPDLKRSREIYSLAFCRGLAAAGLFAAQVELSLTSAILLLQPHLIEGWLETGSGIDLY